MPYLKVYIHLVWSTKNRYPYLHSKSLRFKVWQHIKKNSKKNKIHIDFINGHSDHCHCLVSFGANQTISNVVQMIKGESSFWINKNGLTFERFEWQNEYYAASVSWSMIKKTRDYIRNQEFHHRIKSFQEECEEFIDKYGFERFE